MREGVERGELEEFRRRLCRAAEEARGGAVKATPSQLAGCRPGRRCRRFLAAEWLRQVAQLLGALRAPHGWVFPARELREWCRSFSSSGPHRARREEADNGGRLEVTRPP